MEQYIEQNPSQSTWARLLGWLKSKTEIFLSIFFVTLTLSIFMVISEMVFPEIFSHYSDFYSASPFLIISYVVMLFISALALTFYLLLSPKTKINVWLFWTLVSFIGIFFLSSYLTSLGVLPISLSSSSSYEEGGHNFPSIDKPVIYLYPTKTEDVRVRLSYAGEITSTYPEYSDTIKGWDVTAQPNGTIVNKADGKEYSYLFWEGKNDAKYDMSKGFVVKGKDTKDFLQKTLKQTGLSTKEYNEMIVYWLPKMEHNKYNLIHFANEEYTRQAPLDISPKPDSMLRVFMVYKALDRPVSVQAQNINAFARHGFSVIEWGGSEVK